VSPADLSTYELLEVVGGAILASDPDDVDPDAVAFAHAVLREYGSRIARVQESGPAALAWLQRNDQVARSYLVARLRCPRNTVLAQLYCLPKEIAPVNDSDGLRLLIVPNGKGRLSRLTGKPEGQQRSPGVAWWYVTDDDVWDLGCRCCRIPKGGVRARDFLSEDADRGYSVVLM
jgi:hypothetical protein